MDWTDGKCEIWTDNLKTKIAGNWDFRFPAFLILEKVISVSDLWNWWIHDIYLNVGHYSALCGQKMILRPSFE